jgi:two-component system, response regulator PdtaR
MMDRALKLLVVDDEALIGMWLQSALERLGCEVAGIAATRDEAMEILDRESPDAAFLDICLPRGGDGIAIAREIRERRGIPLVFVTGYADEAIRARAMELSPVAYVSKPTKAETLKGAIEALREALR